MKKYCGSDSCPITNKNICCLSCDNYSDKCPRLCDTAKGIKDKLITNCSCMSK